MRRYVSRRHSMIFSGGCLCGAIRYESRKKPTETGYCHCSICRKSTGAPVVAFASFPESAFTYTKGKPSIYRSSSSGHREFCSKCGTQICYRETDNAETVDINSGTLDDLETVEPKCHIYTNDAVSWLKIEDDYPRHIKGTV